MLSSTVSATHYTTALESPKDAEISRIFDALSTRCSSFSSGRKYRSLTVESFLVMAVSRCRNILDNDGCEVMCEGDLCVCKEQYLKGERFFPGERNMPRPEKNGNKRGLVRLFGFIGIRCFFIGDLTIPVWLRVSSLGVSVVSAVISSSDKRRFELGNMERALVLTYEYECIAFLVPSKHR